MDEDGMQSGKSKLGRFLFFIGLILLVVFFAMDQAKNPSYGYFCIGAIAAILGAILMLRGHKPPDDSMRFRTVRRWREQQRARKAERNKKPEQY
jgi:4-amino-4-deoxy-L-arabinose transferase-like glycosyltransferase